MWGNGPRPPQKTFFSCFRVVKRLVSRYASWSFVNATQRFTSMKARFSKSLCKMVFKFAPSTEPKVRAQNKRSSCGFMKNIALPEPMKKWINLLPKSSIAVGIATTCVHVRLYPLSNPSKERKCVVYLTETETDLMAFRIFFLPYQLKFVSFLSNLLACRVGVYCFWCPHSRAWNLDSSPFVDLPVKNPIQKLSMLTNPHQFPSCGLGWPKIHVFLMVKLAAVCEWTLPHCGSCFPTIYLHTCTLTQGMWKLGNLGTMQGRVNCYTTGLLQINKRAVGCFPQCPKRLRKWRLTCGSVQL